MKYKADKWKPSTTVLQKRAAEAALQFLDFEDRYQKALHDWVGALGYLPEGDFWQLQETFLRDFTRFGCDVDLATDEFVRRPIEADYEADGLPCSSVHLRRCLAVRVDLVNENQHGICQPLELGWW